MKDHRRRFFFWLGVFVLPLFWSWFTLSRKFTWRERGTAFLWLAVFVAWLLHQRAAAMDRFESVAFAYPVILGWVTVALCVWLLFRAGFPATIIEILVLVDVLAVAHPSILFVDRLGKPFEWSWVLVPLAAALGHMIPEWRRLCRRAGASLPQAPSEG
ncbi:hypothetical protein [Prosthecobacter sp.]|uniref:hypothetical protein n=1 Tax=Prosthecobacter sp. TaxID=1965333 RepID=UPI00378344F7